MFSQAIIVALLLASSVFAAPVTPSPDAKRDSITSSPDAKRDSITPSPDAKRDSIPIATGTALAAAQAKSSGTPTTTSSNIPQAPAAAAPAAAPSCTDDGPQVNPILFREMALAPNAVSRLKLLQNDDFVFDFGNPCRKEGVVRGLGGRIVRADHMTFPALMSQGGTLAIGYLGPCGFNTPHVHPRAAELNLVIEGTLFANVVAENGARTMSHTLKKYEMTVFPQGAIHTEFNPECTPSTFVASFPDEDPGVGQVAQEFMSLTKEIVQGSIGGDIVVHGMDIDQYRHLIPANVAKGVDSCLTKCGIAKRKK